MKELIQFLELNGFKLISEEHNVYENNHCSIQIVSDPDPGYYIVTKNATIINDSIWSMFSKDLNIYWLIGVLTYYGYIDKDYKQL